MPVRVLLVDDDFRERKRLARQLTAHPAPFEVVSAADGQEAWALLRRHAFDIVVLDLNLPDTHDHAVLRSIRRRCPDCAVLILSARDDEEGIVTMLRHGADLHLVKSMLQAPGGLGSFILDFLSARTSASGAQRDDPRVLSNQYTGPRA